MTRLPRLLRRPLPRPLPRLRAFPLRRPGTAAPTALLAATLGALLAAASAGPAAAQGATRFTGELGAGVFSAQPVARGHDTQLTVMPYVYAEYGRWFGRVDTFGFKTLALGNGHLELVARFSTEGFKADRPPLMGLRNRSNPSPLGVGTAQSLPFGRLFVYAMHDPSSGGALLEATFGTRVQAGALKLYPLVGVEHRTRQWVNQLYGVSAAEATATATRAYAAPASTVAVAGLAASWPLGSRLSLEGQWRHHWLDDAITRSPLAARSGQHRAYLVLTQRFD
ncbi:MAG: MipA/OmpV family protein [Rubrivivax sp.]